MIGIDQRESPNLRAISNFALGETNLALLLKIESIDFLDLTFL